MNKLLVVDDDGAIRRMIRLNLAATHEVLVTAEPETCAERIDIITTTENVGSGSFLCAARPLG